MAVDREYRIKITTVANTEGAKQTEDALNSLSPKTQEYINKLNAGKDSADKMEVSHRELRFALSRLGGGFAEVGHMAISAFSNPAMLAVLAVVGAMKALDAVMKSQIEADTSELGITRLGPKVEEVRERLIAARTAMLEFNDALEKGESEENKFAEAADAASKALAAQREEEKKNLEAEKEIELKRLELLKSSKQIGEDEYSRRKANIEGGAEEAAKAVDRKAAEDKIKALEERAKFLKERGDAARASVPKLQDAATLAEDLATRAKYAGTTAQVDKGVFDNVAKSGRRLTNAEMESYYKYVEIITDTFYALPELNLEAKKAKDALETAKKAALAANGAEAEVPKLLQEAASLRAVLGIHSAGEAGRAGTTTENREISGLLGSQRATQVFAAGGRGPDAASAQMAIEQMGRMANDYKIIHELLVKVVTHQGNQTANLEALTRRLELDEQKLRGLAVP